MEEGEEEIKVNVRRTQSAIARFENGKREPQTKECKWSLETKLSKETDYPLEHLGTIIIAPWDLFWTFDFQNSNIINLYSFKSCLWQFVTTVI